VEGFSFGPRLGFAGPVQIVYLMSEVDWAAGLFEGEGCLTHRIPPNLRPVLILNSTDLDVLKKFHRVVGVGHMCAPNMRKGRVHKPYWQWQVSIREDVEYVVDLFWNHLGDRRKMRATELGLAPNQGVESQDDNSQPPG